LSNPTRYVTSLGLSWASVTGATTYNLYWSTSLGVTAASTKISNVASVYTHTPLTGGTTYYYKLAAVKNGVEGALSNEVSAAPYTFAAPTITGISPSSGPLAGGTAVTITGTGFRAGATITVGGTTLTGITVVSSSSITGTTAIGSAGARDVVVTNSDGQLATLPSGFSYTTQFNGPASVLVTSNSGLSAILSIYAPTASEMYITNSSGCNSGGVWETVVSSKNWALVNSGDGTGTVYAKFRNASSTSNCVSHRVAVTATPLAVEGAACSALTAQIAARGTGVYLIDPDGAGSLPAENHYCNMDYMGGGWTVVTRTFASNTNIANSIPSTAEYLSTSTVGSLAGDKYILGNNRQGFTNWGAVVNGVGLNPVSDFNGNLQKYSSYVGGSTARSCTWQNGSGDFVIGTTAGGACLKFTSGTNGTWWGASDGSVNAALWIQGSTFNLTSTTVFPPFNVGIINGADNDYCSVIQNGTKTFGHGYTCRQGGLGSQQVAQSDYIEVLAKNIELPAQSSLDVWLDAADLSTMWTDAAKTVSASSNGDLVQVWVDKSVNKRQFTQSTSSLRPALNYSPTHMLNNRPGVLFNSDKLVGTQGIVGQSPITFIGVWKILYSTGESFVWMGAGSAYGTVSDYGYPFTYSTKNLGHRAAWSDVQISPNIPYTSSALGIGHIFATRLDSNGCNFYFNSNQYSWTNAPNNSFGCGWSVMNFNSSNFDLGQTSVSTTAQFVLYEMLLYRKYLTDQEMTTLINYLNSKWAMY